MHAGRRRGLLGRSQRGVLERTGGHRAGRRGRRLWLACARERGLGAEHPLHASSLYDLSALYLRTGNLDQAEALLRQVEWLTPLITILVAYPILSLDQIGIELQNPFITKNMGHLPLDEITAKVEKNLLALLDSAPVAPVEDPAQPPGAVSGNGQDRADAAAPA